MENGVKEKKFIKLLIYLIGMVVLTEADQITKVMAENKLSGKSDYPIIKDVLEFAYLQNNGAAWGMLGGQINLFIILTVFMFILITYVVIRMPYEKKYYPLLTVCTLLGAGAVGNFIDRIRFGYVRDFIYFKLINFPVFNVADICVTVSMILLIILILFVYKEEDFDFLSMKKNKEIVKDKE